jgi:hypothetical protein
MAILYAMLFPVLLKSGKSRFFNFNELKPFTNEFGSVLIRGKIV